MSNPLLSSFVLLLASTAFVSSTSAQTRTAIVQLEDSSPGQVADRRFLQTSEPECKTLGKRYTCGFDFDILTNDNATVFIETNVNCPIEDESSSFDFRNVEEGCSCFALVTTPDGMSKPCPCTVCPAGFGNSPISIDCNYKGRPDEFTPFIYGKCKSLDCAMTCNGKCTEGCEDSKKSCQKSMGCLPTQAPTMAPSVEPTLLASAVPSSVPTKVPSDVPSTVPTGAPVASTELPTIAPTPKDYMPPKKSKPQEEDDRQRLYDDQSRGNLDRRRRRQLRFALY